MSYRQFSLKVESPCTAAWDEMKPVGNNRHCLQCSKDVVDFSILSDTAIQNYFLEHGAKGVCGRFRNTQLETIRITLPSYFFYKKIPAWQKYLVIFLICFGSNVFSFELSVANQQGLHAQTTTAVTGKSKTKKNKRKKFKKKVAQLSITYTEVMGLIAVEPIPKPLLKEESNPENSKKEVIPAKNSGAKTTVGFSNQFPNNKKKKARIFYFPKLEAILPSRLKYPSQNTGPSAT